MQIQPNQFLIRSGSTATPSLVFNLAIGFVGRFTVTETVSPSVPNAPTPSFYSNPVFLNASCQCSPSYPLSISTTTLTPAGVYTVTATATNGTLTHSASATIGVTDVFVPAGGAEMLYKWWFDKPAYPGETLFLEANFTDLGYNSIGITNLQAVFDFGLYGRIIGSTLVVNPYNTGAKGFAITIPTDAALGAHPVTVTISWVIAPYNINQAAQPDVVIQSSIDVHPKPSFSGPLASLLAFLAPAFALEVPVTVFSILIVRRHESLKTERTEVAGTRGTGTWVDWMAKQHAEEE